MKIYNPNLEERAFLYQEAQDLAPLVKELGSLSIMVEEFATLEPKSQPQSSYRVTFLVAPETMGLQIQAENGNLFIATIEAKNEAQKQLNALVNALSPGKLPAELLH